MVIFSIYYQRNFFNNISCKSFFLPPLYLYTPAKGKAAETGRRLSCAFNYRIKEPKTNCNKGERSNQQLDLAMTIQHKISLNNIVKNIESKIGESCIRKKNNGQNWFHVDDNHLVQVKCSLDDLDSFLVVRHAESAERTHLAKDGTRFYPADYHNIDKMILEILEEIWNNKTA